MRIAYLINSVEGGGAASPVPAVTRVLRARGAHVEVFALTRRDGRALAAMHESGLATHVRPGGESDHVAAFRWLNRTLQAWRPDVIWTSLTRATLLGQVVGERLGVPVVSWQHAAYLKPANHLLLRARQASSALWVADSHSVQALTAERLGVGPDRLMLWPLFAADPAAPVAAPWRPGEPVRIGSLGRLHPVKGYDVLIAALAHLKAGGLRSEAPFEVAIAGEGGERPRLQAQIDAAGLRQVALAGFNAKPRDFLAGRHLYVQPSRSEGLCIAAHEAMQAGLPAVASGVGELPHSIIDGATGMIVPPGDPAALAKTLAMLLSHPTWIAPMGVAARDRVLKRFGAEAFEAAGAAILARLKVSLQDRGGVAAARSADSPVTDRSVSRRSG
jgi:glycosyltransferase involved in cell wall biosynthesis